MSFQPLQYKCKELQEKIGERISSGVSWQPTKIPAHFLVEFPSECRHDDKADGEDCDWLVHNHFDVLAEQVTTLQAQLINVKMRMKKQFWYLKACQVIW